MWRPNISPRCGRWDKCGVFERMRDRPLGPFGIAAAVTLLVVVLSRSGSRVRAAIATLVPLVVLARLRSRRPKPGVGGKVPKNVHFNMRVGCMSVPNLLELPESRKAVLWWQPDDFQDFLKVRLEIAKAYKSAAQSLGVEMPSVCSVGSHATQAYQKMIKVYPSLKEESRRGLGLGRKRQRAKNRDAYIAAVVKEQRIQLDAGVHDEEALARVAKRVSEQDRNYAHYLAKMYFEQDNAEDDDDGGMEPADSSARMTNVPGLPDRGSSKETMDEENNSPNRQRLYTEEDINWSSEKTHSAGFAKGFGLSKDKLNAAGLSVTGHSLLQKRSRDTHQEDSELSSCDSDGAGGAYD